MKKTDKITRNIKQIIRHFGTISGFFLLLLLFSCNGLFMDEQKSNTAKNNFDLLWKIIDERYCFFEEKGVDWNQMYEKYSQRINFNDIEPASPHLFSVMVFMLEELRDGHVCLDDGLFGSRCYTGWQGSPADNTNFHSPASLSGTTEIRSGLSTFRILPESIGYIRCPSFSEKFNRNDLEKAIAGFEGLGLKGLIIDIRGNGGGYVSEAYLLASKFVSEKTKVGYARYKIGKRHDDFSEFFARHIEPDGAVFSGNVVILTNRRVYSAANMFVSIMKCLPQVYIIGDLTGGGGGAPISAELLNGWTVKFSTNPVFDTEKESIEQGVLPHQIITNGANNRDNVFEAARQWILER